MVETTTKRAQQLIKTLLSEGHIDKTTAKWLSSDPPRIPAFYTLTKIHNQHLSEDLLTQGVPDLQNESQHLLTTLFS